MKSNEGLAALACNLDSLSEHVKTDVNKHKICCTIGTWTPTISECPQPNDRRAHHPHKVPSQDTNCSGPHDFAASGIF